MAEQGLVNEWLAVFGRDVDKKIMNRHVIASGNYLWHIFTWGNVACLKGEEAKRAFDSLSYVRAIKFYDGRNSRIKNVSLVGKVSAKELDENAGRDVYLVAEDFSWTYVRTHEELCGPYLCFKGKPRTIPNIPLGGWKNDNYKIH